MKFQLESLEITGIDDASYECKQCIEGVSAEGSYECIKCGANTYFADEQCLPCDNNKFSLPNSVGKDSCFEKPPCDERDYNITSVSPCQNGKAYLTYNLTQPILCDVKHKDSLPLEVKKINCTSSNDKCLSSDNSTNKELCSCPSNSYVSTITQSENITKDSFKMYCSLNHEFCRILSGWAFTNNEIVLSKYLPDSELKLEMSKVIKARNNSFPSITFDLTIDLIENEIFLILLNHVLINRYTYVQNEVKSKKEIILLNDKDNFIEFIYYRNKNFKRKGPLTFDSKKVLMENLIIRDSFETGQTECSKCPQGTISNLSGGCKKCDEGLTSNSKSIYF